MRTVKTINIGRGIEYHEERVRRLHKAFKLVLPLLKLRWWVEQIVII